MSKVININPMLLAGVLCFSFSNPSLGQSKNYCAAVLSKDVFNVGEMSSADSYAADYKAAMCKTEWTSESDIKARSSSFGLSYLEIIGLDSSSASNKSSRKKAYKQFCSKSSSEIAYGSSFYTSFRNSNRAVSAWEKCIQNAPQGHYAIVNPGAFNTGAVLNLSITGTGTIVPLDIIDIASVPKNAVRCYSQGKLAQEAVFDPARREFAISCEKDPNATVTFQIDSSWGVFKSIQLNGFNSDIQDLKLEIARLAQTNKTQEASLSTQDQQINLLQTSLNNLKNQSILKNRLYSLKFDRPFDSEYLRHKSGNVIKSSQSGSAHDFRFKLVDPLN